MDEPPLMTHPRPNPIASILSHLAIYPALYTLGVYLLAILSLGYTTPGTTTIAYILIVAHACYLLDRVKVSDANQDPADALALPDRALFFARNASMIRLLLVLELLVSMPLGYLIAPPLGFVPLGALIGVYLYAGRGASPGDPRFKDLPALKSFFIACAHLALVIATLWGNDHDLLSHPRWVPIASLVGIWMIVSADAILCDLDDIESDAIYQTRSLPVLIGKHPAWVVAIVTLGLGCALLQVRDSMSPAMIVVGVLIWVSALPTRVRKNRRDLIDARLLPIVILGMVMR
jgi:4-hydroxybenzoate polyprenyltransferase